MTHCDQLICSEYNQRYGNNIPSSNFSGSFILDQDLKHLIDSTVQALPLYAPLSSPQSSHHYTPPWKSLMSWETEIVSIVVSRVISNSNTYASEIEVTIIKDTLKDDCNIELIILNEAPYQDMMRSLNTQLKHVECAQIAVLVNCNNIHYKYVVLENNIIHNVASWKNYVFTKHA